MSRACCGEGSHLSASPRTSRRTSTAPCAACQAARLQARTHPGRKEAQRVPTWRAAIPPVR